MIRVWPRDWAPSLGRPWSHGSERRDDIVAGIVLTGLLLPAGMGYAEVAGLPAVAGLHATVVCLVAYALVGPSRVLILGPDSSLAPIIAAAILPLAAAGSDEALALAGVLAILSGLVLVVGGLLRLGLVAELLSKPIRVGYLNGVAASLVVTQLPKLLGFSVDADDFVGTGVDVVRGVLDGATNRTALVLGLGGLASIVLLRRLAPRAPGLLVALAGTALVVWLGDLEADVSVIGGLPRALPAPALSSVSWAEVVALLPAAFGIALIASADTAVLSRSIGAQDSGQIDESHEMAALGIANVATGALGGFPVSASSSRTPVALRSGAGSQLTGLVGAGLVAAVALLAPHLTAHVPSSALAAVVIVAASGLADPSDLLRLWRARRSEGALAVGATLGVVFAGVLWGIGVAVAISLLTFVAHAWRPYRTELVRVDRRKGYHDVQRHPSGARIPGLVIARFDAPLFFANVGVFTDFVHGLVDDRTERPSWVLVAAEPITDIDVTAAEGLVSLDDQLQAAGVRLVFAEMKGPAKDRLGDYGYGERFADRQFPTIGSAVTAYVGETDTPWHDWTDEVAPPGQDTATGPLE